MAILSLYILLGRGRNWSHPILIGCWTLDSAISFVQNPVMWLVGDPQSSFGLNKFIIDNADRACVHPHPSRGMPFVWRLNGYSARNMKCAITTCTRKSTSWYFKTLDFKRCEVWKVRKNVLWRHTVNWYFKRCELWKKIKKLHFFKYDFFFNVW
jgi:hypothetical protein